MQSDHDNTDGIARPVEAGDFDGFGHEHTFEYHGWVALENIEAGSQLSVDLRTGRVRLRHPDDTDRSPHLFVDIGRIFPHLGGGSDSPPEITAIHVEDREAPCAYVLGNGIVADDRRRDWDGDRYYLAGDLVKFVPNHRYVDPGPVTDPNDIRDVRDTYGGESDADPHNQFHRYHQPESD